MEEKSKTPARTTKSTAPSFNLKKADETLELAKDLANFIKEKKLTTQVQGKDFVNVEGWQYAGSRLGIVPIVDSITNMSTDGELKYMAQVHLYDLNNKATVGAGFAICSNKEQGKKFYQEFAIASMAQTRAVGKAYRNILSWIIRAAGYEPTPAEEMEYGGNDAGTSAEVVQEPAPMRAVPAEQHAPAVAEPLAPAANNPAYATAEQKEEIIRLLGNAHITRQENTKMLLNINKLDQERAEQAISNLKKTIEDREAAQPQPAEQAEAPAPNAAPAPAPSAANGNKPMSRHQREDIILLTNYPAFTSAERSEHRMGIGSFNRIEADAKKAELRGLIAERTPDKQPPAELPGEKFERVAKEYVGYARQHQTILGPKAYEDACAHVKGVTVTAAELETQLQQYRDEVEAVQAA